MKTFSNFFLEEYDWNEQLQTYIDRSKVKTAPDLTADVSLSTLQSMPYINAYKAVYSPDQNFSPAADFKDYSSHFGSLEQSRERFEVMEEDDWYIYKYTIDLQKVCPILFEDSGGNFNHHNDINFKRAREKGYTVVAYHNTAEGDTESENLSLVILDKGAIL
jgi:hypothetical protein